MSWRTLEPGTAGPLLSRRAATSSITGEEFESLVAQLFLRSFLADRHHAHRDVDQPLRMPQRFLGLVSGAGLGGGLKNALEDVLGLLAGDRHLPPRRKDD